MASFFVVRVLVSKLEHVSSLNSTSASSLSVSSASSSSCNNSNSSSVLSSACNASNTSNTSKTRKRKSMHADDDGRASPRVEEDICGSALRTLLDMSATVTATEVATPRLVYCLVSLAFRALAAGQCICCI